MEDSLMKTANDTIEFFKNVALEAEEKRQKAVDNLLIHVHERDGYIELLRSQFRDCVNELCLMCGKYHDEHEGACDGCRWLMPRRGW